VSLLPFEGKLEASVRTRLPLDDALKWEDIVLSMKDLTCKNRSGVFVYHVCLERLFSTTATCLDITGKLWQVVPGYDAQRSLRRKDRTVRGGQWWLLNCSWSG